MNASATYTLLIVESPVIARIIQRYAPSSVYVMSTSGYAWKPVYDPGKHQLKAIADPDQLGFRKELKQQASWAGNVIIATDSDPSGDFIAWSVFKFLKDPSVKRSYIQHLGRRGIERLISKAEVIQPDHLELRLKNRSLIRHQWKLGGRRPSMQIAALASVFSSHFPFRNFKDQSERRWISSQPIRCNPDEWIPLKDLVDESEYHSVSPLSTFDLLEKAIEQQLFSSLANAQESLQQLFTHTLELSDESLISYPRTAANSYFSETWGELQKQFYRVQKDHEFKPMFIRNIAGSEVAHESIYPLNLPHTPESVSGELLSTLRDLYALIYRHTIKAISVPKEKYNAYRTPFHPDTNFYLPVEDSVAPSTELMPVRTISETGALLHQLQVQSPSSFGKKMDRWQAENYIEIENTTVKPGKYLTPYLNDGSSFAKDIGRLNSLSANGSATAETIREALS
ncbi:DNA topoisomerase [Rhodohalobacter halophilus]|uniref:DNA topoisomerase n=1 Tax=Rhodohalobacter halophilus TaxID=1812810 RepID=UPI00083F7D0C|nr:DNA topoisomerase [Rhodohalobacter halophilus]